MVTTQIRCLVIRIPEETPAVRPQAAWREALPWADPYILGLIAKLQREVRLERAAQFMAEKEMAERDMAEQELNEASDGTVEETIIDAEEFTAEEWDESIRGGPRKCK